MKDYFFDYCDARSELAGSRVTIETLMNAVESKHEIMLEVALKLAKEQIESINKALET